MDENILDMASTTFFRSQDDFSVLGLAESLDDSHGVPAIDRTGSGLLKSESKRETTETYCPGNFIPDEFYELFRIWELSRLKRQKATDTVDSVQSALMTDSSTESVYEPMRIMDVPATPPKRFHRTFWRSLTLRVVRLEKKKAFDRSAAMISEMSIDGSSTSGMIY